MSNKDKNGMGYGEPIAIFVICTRHVDLIPCSFDLTTNYRKQPFQCINSFPGLSKNCIVFNFMNYCIIYLTSSWFYHPQHFFFILSSAVNYAFDRRYQTHLGNRNRQCRAPEIEEEFNADGCYLDYELSLILWRWI